MQTDYNTDYRALSNSCVVSCNSADVELEGKETGLTV